MRGGHCTAYIEDAPDSFIQLEPFLIRSSNPSSEFIGLIVFGNFMKRYDTKGQKKSKSRLACPGRGVSEKVSAVSFCIGSGLFGSCNSN